MRDRLAALKLPANIYDDETKDYDEPSTTVNLENIFMDNFFQDVATIRGNIDKIAQDVDQIKKMHSALLSTAAQKQDVKDELERLMYDVRTTANSVRSSLKEMERRMIQKDMESPSQKNQAESRIRRCQHSTLARKFVEVMSDYNTTQSEYREMCKARIQRQLEIAGKTKTYDEVEEMLEGGDPAIFTSDIVTETQQARQALGDIEARHRDIINLEKSIQELHEMFLDMAVLVESQGEMIDQIEYNVEKAAEFVGKAERNINKAREHEDEKRRKKIILIICLLVLLAIIVAVLYAVLR